MEMVPILLSARVLLPTIDETRAKVAAQTDLVLEHGNLGSMGASRNFDLAWAGLSLSMLNHITDNLAQSGLTAW